MIIRGRSLQTVRCVHPATKARISERLPRSTKSLRKTKSRGSAVRSELRV